MYEIKKPRYSYNDFIKSLRKTTGYVHMGETGDKSDIFLTPFGAINVYKEESLRGEWKMCFRVLSISKIEVEVEPEMEEDYNGGDRYEDRM